MRVATHDRMITGAAERQKLARALQRAISTALATAQTLTEHGLNIQALERQLQTTLAAIANLRHRLEDFDRRLGVGR